jgi:uncharacterized membrane protein YidH (DUF202 family)
MQQPAAVRRLLVGLFLCIMALSTLFVGVSALAVSYSAPCADSPSPCTSWFSTNTEIAIVVVGVCALALSVAYTVRGYVARVR